MRVLIHIGTHKTGTTSLQELLYANRAALLEHGILYPDAGAAHHGSLLNVRQPHWTADIFRPAFALAKARSARLLLLSCEVVSTFSAAQYAQLLSAFEGHEVGLVACLRHWSEFWPSRWAQYCRRRDSQSLAGYLEAIGPSSTHIDRRYDLVLDRAAATGAELRIVSYDNAVAEAGSVLPAMLSAFGLDGLFEDKTIAAPRSNARLDWQEVEMLRLLNGLRADARGLPQDELFLATRDFGQCRTFFGMPSRLAKVPLDLREELATLVAAREIAVPMPLASTAAIEDEILSRHAGRVANLRGGHLFASPGKHVTRGSDLDWRELQARLPNLASRLIAAID